MPRVLQWARRFREFRNPPNLSSPDWTLTWRNSKQPCHPQLTASRLVSMRSVETRCISTEWGTPLMLRHPVQSTQSTSSANHKSRLRHSSRLSFGIQKEHGARVRGQLRPLPPNVQDDSFGDFGDEPDYLEHAGARVRPTLWNHGANDLRTINCCRDETERYRNGAALLCCWRD